MSPVFSRQRDLFPLPLFVNSCASKASQLSRGVRSRINNRESWSLWANKGIQTVNELSGRGQSISGPASLAQSKCLENFEQCYRGFSSGPPVSSVPRGDASLREVLSTAYCYDSMESSTVQPYDMELVSWPEEGSSPASLEGLLSAADRSSFMAWESKLFRTSEEAEALQQ